MTHDDYLDHVQDTACIALSEWREQRLLGDDFDLDNVLDDVVSWRYHVHPLAHNVDDMDWQQPAYWATLNAARLAYLDDARKALADIVALGY